VTVPSTWVAEPFKRDMRIEPTVIGHGVDCDLWQPAAADRPFYALWAKNRSSDVCDPSPAVALASWGIDVISTFAPHGVSTLPPNLRVIGSQPHATMRELVRHAGVYLATTRETFGIGTLEALASGVPVLGYDYGGTADLVEHQVSGYLVAPGDVDGLLAGLDWLKQHPEVGAQARKRATAYSWDRVAARYADLYHQVAERRRSERHGVTRHDTGAMTEISLDSLSSYDASANFAEKVCTLSTPMNFAASVASSDESIPPLMKTPTGTSDITCFSTARSISRRVSRTASRGEIFSIANEAGSQ
jgi:hypothetical protein